MTCTLTGKITLTKSSAQAQKLSLGPKAELQSKFQGSWTSQTCLTKQSSLPLKPYAHDDS